MRFTLLLFAMMTLLIATAVQADYLNCGAYLSSVEAGNSTEASAQAAGLDQTQGTTCTGANALGLDTSQIPQGVEISEDGTTLNGNGQDVTALLNQLSESRLNVQNAKYQLYDENDPSDVKLEGTINGPIAVGSSGINLETGSVFSNSYVTITGPAVLEAHGLTIGSGGRVEAQYVTPNIDMYLDNGANVDLPNEMQLSNDFPIAQNARVVITQGTIRIEDDETVSLIEFEDFPEKTSFYIGSDGKPLIDYAKGGTVVISDLSSVEKTTHIRPYEDGNFLRINDVLIGPLTGNVQNIIGVTATEIEDQAGEFYPAMQIKIDGELTQDLIVKTENKGSHALKAGSENVEIITSELARAGGTLQQTIKADYIAKDSRIFGFTIDTERVPKRFEDHSQTFTKTVYAPNPDGVSTSNNYYVTMKGAIEATDPNTQLTVSTYATVSDLQWNLVPSDAKIVYQDGNLLRAEVTQGSLAQGDLEIPRAANVIVDYNQQNDPTTVSAQRGSVLQITQGEETVRMSVNKWDPLDAKPVSFSFTGEEREPNANEVLIRTDGSIVVGEKSEVLVQQNKRAQQDIPRSVEVAGTGAHRVVKEPLVHREGDAEGTVTALDAVGNIIITQGPGTSHVQGSHDQETTCTVTGERTEQSSPQSPGDAAAELSKGFENDQPDLVISELDETYRSTFGDSSAATALRKGDSYLGDVQKNPGRAYQTEYAAKEYERAISETLDNPQGLNAEDPQKIVTHASERLVILAAIEQGIAAPDTAALEERLAQDPSYGKLPESVRMTVYGARAIEDNHLPASNNIYKGVMTELRRTNAPPEAFYALKEIRESFDNPVSLAQN